MDESNRLFSFPERSIAYEILSIYVTKKIDAVEVDFLKLERNYPAFSLALGHSRNAIGLRFLESILLKLLEVKRIVIDTHHPSGLILRGLSPVTFRRLNSMETSNFQEKKYLFDIIPNESPLQFLCVWHERTFNLLVKWNYDEKSHDHNQV